MAEAPVHVVLETPEDARATMIERLEALLVRARAGEVDSLLMAARSLPKLIDGQMNTATTLDMIATPNATWELLMLMAQQYDQALRDNAARKGAPPGALMAMRPGPTMPCPNTFNECPGHPMCKAGMLGKMDLCYHLQRESARPLNVVPIESAREAPLDIGELRKVIEMAERGQITGIVIAYRNKDTTFTTYIDHESRADATALACALQARCVEAMRE